MQSQQSTYDTAKYFDFTHFSKTINVCMNQESFAAIISQKLNSVGLGSCQLSRGFEDLVNNQTNRLVQPCKALLILLFAFFY